MKIRPWRTTLILGLSAAAISGCETIEATRARIVQTPARCVDQTVQIYFEPDSVEVTPEGRAVVTQAATAARGCMVERVDVLGLADAVGAPEANLELSKRRAQSVTAVLANAGLPDAEFHVEGGGQAGAVAPNGATAPLRRRADIILHLKAR